MGGVIGGVTPRTRLRRLPELGSYDADVVYGILDATSICHVGTIVDDTPMVLPMLHVRHENRLLIHGSRSNRLLRSMTELDAVCVTVTLNDGLIVARSTFNSSVAYRSAVVFGKARLLENDAESSAALDRLIVGVLPGRSREVRPSHDSEMARTSVVEVLIEEASAKISVGPPDDDDEDVETDVWAGVLHGEFVYTGVTSAPDGPVGRGEVDVAASVTRLLRDNS